MTKSEFEELLRVAGDIGREREFISIGSQALRAVSPTIPRDFPKTFEADLYPRHRPEGWAVLREKLGATSRFFKRKGFYVDCANPALSTLPDGWTDRLIPFRTPRTRGVTAWCLDPHDLFVSKLVAWRDKDRLFLAMLRHRFARPAKVVERIRELFVPDGQKQELITLLRQLIAKQRAERKAKAKRARK